MSLGHTNMITVYRPLWWQRRGLSYTASGYGSKIPTGYMVKVRGRLRRVYQPDPPDTGEELDLDREESHHLTRVLRLQVGAEVGVFDGRGREWTATLTVVEPGHIRLKLLAERQDPVESPLPVTLFQALGRSDRLEYVIQKGTEIGVAGFHLLRAERSEGDRRNARRIERWARIAREACKQSGRRRVPEIAGPSDLPGTVPDGVTAWVLDPGPGAEPLMVLLDGPRPGALWLAVGPEGGFTLQEIEGLRASGWTAAGLGPRVLRTETAGIVAASLALDRWADLGAAPR